MTIEAIEQKVIEQAKTEAEKIKREAMHEASKICSAAEEQAKKLEAEILEEARKLSEEEKRKILSPARINTKKRALEARQKLIDRVFSEALSEFSDQKDSDYKKIIKALLVNMPLNGKLIPAKGRTTLTKEAVAELKLKGLKVLEASEKISGGFIFEGDKINIDQSFETILKNLREKLEPKIIDILFMGE